MIRFININKIYPHPVNPRKDLGDISELAESVKASGILQNLTVVKQIESTTGEWIEGTYTVVIGHRRLAAAKLAGLEEVPCIISDMDHKTQIATMLLENMQRSDLTAYEQAQGFQMMLDLGETVVDISEKTGFSESTVRRRTKLLELDQDKLRESASRGGTLTDYLELEKIKDINLRNEVLETIGTEDFNFELKSALATERKEEIKEKLITKISEFATRVGEIDWFKLEHINTFRYDEDDLNKEIKVENDRKYYFKVDHWCITLYADRLQKNETEAEKEERIKREKEQQKEKERLDKLNEITKRTEELREDFINTLSNTKIKNHIQDLMILTLKEGIEFRVWREDYYEKIFEIDIDEEFKFEMVEEKVTKTPELYLLKTAYYSHYKGLSYMSWSGKYIPDDSLDNLYELLIKLGYELSEEEKQLKDGTHELFKTQEVK